MRRMVFAVVILLAWGLFAATPPNPDLEARRKALNDLLREQWDYSLAHNPVFASIIGDKRWNDKLDDFSQKAIDEDLAHQKQFLARFAQIDTSGFPEQEQLNKVLMVRNLRETVENARFKDWEMPVTQISGVHLDIPQVVSLLPFSTVKDYEDYISRLKQLPRLMDETVIQMRKGTADGLMPPKFLLEKVVGQCEGIASQNPEQSPFFGPANKFAKDFPEAEQKRLRGEMLAAIRDQVLPAYARFAKFVKEEYAPKGRTEPGVWALPDGEARYAAAVRSITTTNLTPEQIHQIGLREVTRIEQEQLAIARKLGYQDVKSFNAAVKADPKLHARSREQILNLYRKYIDEMKPELPKLFGRLPKAGVVVMPVESFREKDAPDANYNPGTADGSRPGHVMVNTGNPQSRTLIDIESTAYHEGVPGHHLQLSIAQELPTLPPFRQYGGYTAFVEGWALYSEQLGKDIGLYQDPYEDYGRLESEMLRAIRLVVDTGLHYKHWTRDQVVQFFHDHSAIDEVTVQNETNRYISWPAQALGYKVGELKILELRERARKELGDKFDIRQFHDKLLDAGALPLDVLEVRIHSWVTSKGQVAAGTGATSTH